MWQGTSQALHFRLRPADRLRIAELSAPCRFVFAFNAERKRRLGLGFEFQAKPHLCFKHLLRRWMTLNPGPPLDAIQSITAKDDQVSANFRRQQFATALAAHSSYLENVCEISGKRDVHWNVKRFHPVIDEFHFLVHRSMPKEF